MPPWLLARVVTGRARTGRDPSFVVASSWSVVVVLPRLASVLLAVVLPKPVWLVMPPFGDHAATPDATWCAYSHHARASECATALNDARCGHVAGIGRFQFADARCVPDVDVRRPSPHEAAVARLASALEGVLGAAATVRRDVELGGDHVDVAVASGERVLLAADVEIRRWQQPTSPPRPTLLSHGVAEYWRVIVHPNRDPAALDEVEQWRADETTRSFTLAGGSSRSQDVSLRIAALPSLRLPLDDVLPDPCDVQATSHPIVRTVV